MAPTSFGPGETLDRFPSWRFQFTGDVGRGTYAKVAEAFDFKLRRNVALKLSFDSTALARQHEGDMDGEQLLALAAKLAGRYTALREARLLAMVDHPNVIQVLDIGLLDDERIAIVMPYLEGGTLAQREFTGPLEEVLDVALQIGWGLSALHDIDILHRDLKPANILFDHYDCPRIIDLGLACRTNDKAALAERVGTQHYMAPDVFTRGCRDVRDDLYAYCMIVYEMLNGCSPFASASAREHGRVSPSTRPGVPPELHEILARGLAADADARWEGMKPLLRALDRVRNKVQPTKSWPPRPRRWQWAAVCAVLVSGIGIGVAIDERAAKADECADVMDELSMVWTPEIRAGLTDVFGTRKVGDDLELWANRWLAVRAEECRTARDAGRSMAPTPCSAGVRERFEATVHAFRSPALRRGLKFATVIAELPAPEYCIEHPDDTDWGHDGLLALQHIDVEVEALARAGDLDGARSRQTDYMKLALEQGSELGVARAIYFRAKIHRLEGRLDVAAEEFELALDRSFAIGAPVFTAECLLELAALAGERGEMGVVDAYSQLARPMFARYRAERVAEVLEVQGLALLAGSERQRRRGVALLLNAVELREQQLREQIGTWEWLSQARQSYARGLLAVGRAAEAIEQLDLALEMHRERFGHGTWRTREISMLQFSALIELRRFDDSVSVAKTILRLDADAELWPRYAKDAWWMAREYETAGDLRGAAFVLRAGRDMAIQHGSDVNVGQFERAIEDLAARL